MKILQSHHIGLYLESIDLGTTSQNSCDSAYQTSFKLSFRKLVSEGPGLNEGSSWVQIKDHCGAIPFCYIVKDQNYFIFSFGSCNFWCFGVFTCILSHFFGGQVDLLKWVISHHNLETQLAKEKDQIFRSRFHGDLKSFFLTIPHWVSLSSNLVYNFFWNFSFCQSHRTFFKE